MALPAWMVEMYEAVDAFDVPRFGRFLDDSVQFRFANNPVLSGRAAACEMVEGLFGSLKAIRHDELMAWEPDEQTAICRGHVTYTRLDDSTHTVPFAVIFHLTPDRLIREYLVYADISQLFAPTATA